VVVAKAGYFHGCNLKLTMELVKDTGCKGFAIYICPYFTVITPSVTFLPY
jgi:hypothetical protein